MAVYDLRHLASGEKIVNHNFLHGHVGSGGIQNVNNGNVGIARLRDDMSPLKMSGFDIPIS